jgi:integrase
MLFDLKAARALEPGQHLIVPGAPGLRLMAAETTRTWTYRYRAPDGKLKQVKIGHWPAMGLPAALAAWQRAKEARDGGADLAEEKRQKRRDVLLVDAAGKLTVAAGCADYLRAYKLKVTPKTYTEAARLVALELGPIEGKPMAEVTRADAFDLLESMLDKPVIAVRVRQLMGAVWDRALDAGRLPPDTPNWWRLVMRGKIASKGKIVGGKHRGVEKRHLSAEEVSALLAWLPNFSRDIQDVCTLYFWTCCRGAEIVAMARDEIAAEKTGLWWTIPKEKLKMRRNPLLTDLRVPLVGRALAVVKRRLESTSGPWLFPSRGASGHIEQKAVGVAIWTHFADCKLRPDWVRPRIPVAPFAAHDLRRTSRTMLSELGCPADVAEAIIGHMLPGVHGVYNRNTFDAERVIWLGRLSDRLEALAAGK